MRRLARNFGFATAILLLSLGVGMAGYHFTEGLSWIDSMLNASMLLGGMGPIWSPATPGGKLFVAGIIPAPVVHRVLHRFHWSDR